MKRKRATKAEMAARIERVRELAAQGMSQQTIASLLGIKKRNLSHAMQKRGIKTTHGNCKEDERESVLGMIAAGYRPEDAAQKAGVHFTTAYKWRREAKEAAQ